MIIVAFFLQHLHEYMYVYVNDKEKFGISTESSYNVSKMWSESFIVYKAYVLSILGDGP